MYLKYISMLCLTVSLINPAFSATILCDKNTKPALKQSMKDWEIIAGNTANIPTAEYFHGTDLSYKLQSGSKYKQNKISIDAHTGKLVIKAEKKDNFDVDIIASNQCGSAKGKFNVKIDEEE